MLFFLLKCNLIFSVQSIEQGNEKNALNNQYEILRNIFTHSDNRIKKASKENRLSKKSELEWKNILDNLSKQIYSKTYQLFPPVDSDDLEITDGTSIKNSNATIIKFNEKSFIKHALTIIDNYKKTEFFDLTNCQPNTKVIYDKRWEQLLSEFFDFALNNTDIMGNFNKIILIPIVEFLEIQLDENQKSKLKEKISDFIDSFVFRVCNKNYIVSEISPTSAIKSLKEILENMIIFNHEKYYDITDNKKVNEIDKEKKMNEVICKKFGIGERKNSLESYNILLEIESSNDPANRDLFDSSYFQDFLGHIFYDSGNYDKAIKCFKKAAGKLKDKKNQNAYSSCAMNDLAVIYKKQGNHSKALQYYEKSAKYGNAMGQCNLGVIYMNGQLNQSKNIKLAYKYLKESAESNCIYGINNFGGLCLLIWRRLEQKKINKIEEYDEPIEEYDEPIEEYIEECLKNKKTKQIDFDTEIRTFFSLGTNWIKKSIKMGCSCAITNVVLSPEINNTDYEPGVIKNENFEESIKLLYENYKTIDQRIFFKAIGETIIHNNKHNYYLFLKGMCYEMGIGCEINPFLSLYYYLLSEDEKFFMAKANVELMANRIKEMKKDTNKYVGALSKALMEIKNCEKKDENEIKEIRKRMESLIN